MFFIFVVLLTAASAQVTFERHYGGESAEWGFCVQQTADSGYIVAGTTLSFGAGFYDGWLVRTDARGETLWTRAYGGTTGDYFYGVENAAGGGFLAVGYTGSSGAGGTDVWLVRTDSSGDTLWTRTYGGTAHDGATSLHPTADSGYVIAGVTSSFGAGDYDGWLLKINSSGETLWTRTYGGSGLDAANYVDVTADGGFILTGLFDRDGALGGDLWLVRTDSLGDTIWTKTLPASGHEDGYCVEETEDGGYIVVGATSSFGAGNYDLWLVRTDSEGETLWTKTFGGIDWDEGKGVRQLPDGGFVVVGSVKPPLPDNRKVWLLRTDSDGDTLWTRFYGGQSTSWGEWLELTSDGGMVMTGMTQGDIHLVKTDADGLLALADRGPVAVSDAHPATLVRGVLKVPRDMNEIRSGISGRVPRPALLDAIGRKVLDLHPGANDVRHLAPGVYCVREKSSRTSRQPSAAIVRKVIITR